MISFFLLFGGLNLVLGGKECELRIFQGFSFLLGGVEQCSLLSYTRSMFFKQEANLLLSCF